MTPPRDFVPAGAKMAVVTLQTFYPVKFDLLAAVYLRKLNFLSVTVWNLVMSREKIELPFDNHPKALGRENSFPQVIHNIKAT